MENKIRELAKKRPELSNMSGKGFWPVPAFFPLLLSHTIHCLQNKITELYLKNDGIAKELSEIRIALLNIVFEGDLGEDHTGLFIKDHPNKLDEYKNLPFYNFCQGILKINNPIILLGILTRNEEGSLEEAKALVETKIINVGIFSQIHLIEEEKHARISESIKNKLLKNVQFKEDFLKGIDIHDELYSSIVQY